MRTFIVPWQSIPETRGARRALSSVAPAAMVVLLSMGAPRVMPAQVVPGEAAAIGSLGADRRRLNQITGGMSGRDADSVAQPGVRIIAPTIQFIRNSELPSFGNDGALWAGRGANMSVSGGLGFVRELSSLRAELVLAPVVTYSQNVPFQFLPGRAPGRSPFSSPWHIGAASADLPLRFGDQQLRTVGPGQSAVTLTTGAVSFGASSTNEWWGPALRNTLVLSDNAAGIPRLFIRTARPLRNRAGWFEGRLIVGGLTESPFFDHDPTNDARAVSGLLLTFRPAADSGLTLGLSRLVVAPVASNTAVFGHAFDVLTRWEPVRAAGDTLASGVSRQRTDQIFSLFARWVFPESGVEAYGEWARTELPRSLREYLEAPQSTQAYTLGLQWAAPTGGGRRVRLQGELTYLEQTDIWPERPPMDYYTGRAAVQGFTQRGQVLGAAIGPGSSSQFVAADWLAAGWQVGLLTGRTRTENDALYRQPGASYTRHDVAYFGGVRGGIRFRRTDLSGELVASRRLNYLFQSEFWLSTPVIAIDVPNVSITVRVGPR